MKVRELIKRLQGLPADTDVLVYAGGDNGGFYNTADDVWIERGAEDEDNCCCIGTLPITKYYEHQLNRGQSR